HRHSSTYNDHMEQVDEHIGTNHKPGENSDSDELGRVGRVIAELRGLIGDVKEWAELRLQLLQFQVEERIEKFAVKVLAAIMTTIVGVLSLLFLLIAA